MIQINVIETAVIFATRSDAGRADLVAEPILSVCRSAIPVTSTHKHPCHHRRRAARSMVAQGAATGHFYG
jgi:hypothetical protein